MNIPNILSITRIILIPVVIFALFKLSLLWFLTLMLIAASTDIADGWLARKLSQETKIGSVLDISADRLFVISLFIALAIKFDLSVYLISAMLFRDIVVIIGRIVIHFKYKFSQATMIVRPSFFGKLTTAVQVITIMSITIGIFHIYFIQITIWLSLFTGIHYLYLGTKALFLNKATDK